MTDVEVTESVEQLLRFIERGELAFHEDRRGRAQRAVLERGAVTEALRSLGTRAPEALSRLVAILGHNPYRSFLSAWLSMMFTVPARRRLETAGRRWRAARALGLSGSVEVATGPLVEALGDLEPFVRISAAEVLGHLGCNATSVINALTAALSDWNKRVRFEAAEALSILEPGFLEAIPALAANLSSKDWAWRERAAQALGRMGPHAASAAPLLLEAIGLEREEHLKGVQRQAYLRITGTLVGDTQYS